MDDALLEEIKLAYKVHHIRPIQGFFFIRRNFDDFACPLTALAIHRGIMDGVRPGIEFDGGAIDSCANITVDWAVKTFGKEWVMGFLDGVDGQTMTGNEGKYQEGYRLGVALAQQILPVS